MNSVEERQKEPSIEALKQWQSDSGSTSTLEGNAFLDGWQAAIQRVVMLLDLEARNSAYAAEIQSAIRMLAGKVRP